MEELEEQLQQMGTCSEKVVGEILRLRIRAKEKNYEEILRLRIRAKEAKEEEIRWLRTRAKEEVTMALIVLNVDGLSRTSDQHFNLAEMYEVEAAALEE